MNIGKNVKTYRRMAELTQQQLADKCGLSRVGISDIERGKFNPSIITLQIISKKLKVGIEKLLA